MPGRLSLPNRCREMVLVLHRFCRIPLYVLRVFENKRAMLSGMSACICILCDFLRTNILRIIKRLGVREMGRIRWVGIGVFLALLVIGLSRSAFAKGPPDKVIVQGPGLSGEVEITDPRRLQAFGFFQFEDISQRVDPPSDPGPGYVITRYVRDPARGWIAWNRLIYYPPRGGRPGVVWAEGLSVTTNYDGFWYAVSAEGSG
jgi:hypothetical protein